MSDPACTHPGVDELTDRQRQILAFERGRWLHQGAKDTAVRDLFGVSPWRYQQELLAVIQMPAALAAEPQLVNRLHRLRETRRARRAG